MRRLPPILTGLVALAWLGVAGCDAVRVPKPSLVRETQIFVVNGVTETWRLEWAKAPVEHCPAEPVGKSMSCPCDNMRYGEAGELWLIRTRAGSEVERMNLGPLFDNRQWNTGQPAGTAYLAHWPAEDDDWNAGKAGANLTDAVKRRPPIKVMTPADYDHDGQASEFVLPLGTMTCGHHWYAVVGVSKRDPHLHAFASVEKSHEPLVLDLPDWQAMQAAKTQVTLTDVDCGDHGSDMRNEHILSATAGIIHARERSTSCELLAKQGAFGKR